MSPDGARSRDRHRPCRDGERAAMLGGGPRGLGGGGLNSRSAARPLSGIAAENLEGGSGIGSRTLASLEQGWGAGARCALPARHPRDRRGWHGRLAAARAGAVAGGAERRAKGWSAGSRSPACCQSIEAGADVPPGRSLTDRHGGARIGEVCAAKREDWQTGGHAPTGDGSDRGGR